jgi:site-specific DNA-methyltransferase (cytosine-N4-specific)
VNNQRVLQEYSDSQKELLESGKYNDGKRPSGWDIDPDSFANENEGSIPKNLIEASNTASNTHYLEMCRKFDFDSHPARFPRQIPEFFIEMLTPDPPYDEWDRGTLDRPIVLDIFAGSNLTGKVAETTDRYWLAFEEKERYVQTSEFRFRTEEQIRKQLDGSQSGLKGFDGPESS